MRLSPQLSMPVTLPQFLASRAQKVASFSTVQLALALIVDPVGDHVVVAGACRSWLPETRSLSVCVP